MGINAGDLARAVTHDPSEEWPTKMEIVATWVRDGRGNRGRRRVMRINPDQFFGLGDFGAPMSGEQLIGMINKLRMQGRWFGLRKPGVGNAKSKRRK